MIIGDRVVEVNGVNVEAMSHSEVVNEIRTDPLKAILLVVDKITDAYLKKIQRPVTSSLSTYTSVHEITIEEAERLQELRLKDETGDEKNEEDQEVEEDENEKVAGEEQNIEIVEQTSPLQNREQEEEIGSPPSVPPSSPPVPPPADEYHQSAEIVVDNDIVETLSSEPLMKIKEKSLHNEENIPAIKEQIPPNESPASENQTPLTDNGAPVTEKNHEEVLPGEELLRDSPFKGNVVSASKQQEISLDNKKKNDVPSFKKKFFTTPKRKEVKQTGDWHSKLDAFNNL